MKKICKACLFGGYFAEIGILCVLEYGMRAMQKDSPPLFPMEQGGRFVPFNDLFFGYSSGRDSPFFVIGFGLPPAINEMPSKALLSSLHRRSGTIHVACGLLFTVRAKPSKAFPEVASVMRALTAALHIRVLYSLPAGSVKPFLLHDYSTVNTGVSGAGASAASSGR